MYNYLKNLENDIKEHIKENYTTVEEAFEDYENNFLYDNLFIEDSVTGNASGSYTFNTYRAEENLCHNLDLLKEACDEFCEDINSSIENPEGADVTIRCYLLGEALADVMSELVDCESISDL